MYTGDSTLGWTALLATKYPPSGSAWDHSLQTEYRWFSSLIHPILDWLTLNTLLSPWSDDRSPHPKSRQSGCQDIEPVDSSKRQWCSQNCPFQLLESGIAGSEDSPLHSTSACSVRWWWEPQSAHRFSPTHTHKCLPITDDTHPRIRRLTNQSEFHRDELPTRH